MNFYTTGDSHSIVFSKSKFCTKNYWLGGLTMNRVGRILLNFKSMDVWPIDPVHYSIPNDGILLVSFGEIDVRNHIHKQVGYGRDIHEICSTLVENYVGCLLINRQLNGYENIAILAINPPRRADDRSIEVKGSDKERKRYQVLLNTYLKKACEENSFYFFDLNSYYSDSDGFLDSNKRDDSVHLIFSDFIDESI